MRILIESSGTHGEHMRELTAQKIRFDLRRWSHIATRIKVLFTDINGPRGGVDKRCQLEINIGKVGTVVIASLASDWRTALDKSMGRATRVLKRSLQQNHKSLRDRTSKLSFSSLLLIQNRKITMRTNDTNQRSLCRGSRSFVGFWYPTEGQVGLGSFYV